MLRRTLRRRAVTGAELIIVTGLIMGMVANANYRQAIDRAREAVLANNLRQVYMLFQMEGELPRAAFYPENPRTDANSLLKLAPQAAGPLSAAHHPEKLREAGLSYVFNDELGGKALGQIQNPGQTWLLLEATILVPELRNQPGARFVALYADGSVRTIDALPRPLAEKIERARQEER